jgi:hypothetical protein
MPASEASVLAAGFANDDAVGGITARCASRAVKVRPQVSRLPAPISGA